MHEEITVPQREAYSNLIDWAAPEVTSGSEPVLHAQGTSFGSVVIAQKILVEDQVVWHHGLAHAANDHRHYELTQSTLKDQFAQYYLILKDQEGTSRAVQPVFLVKQDLLAGMPKTVEKYLNGVRRLFPDFLKMPMMMVGCSAGEGQLPRDWITGSEHWVADALNEALESAARYFKARMIVFKDFPKLYRKFLDPLKAKGFSRIPSMPGSSLSLDFSDFEDYITNRLSAKTRKNLRKKFRQVSDQEPIALEVVHDVSPYLDQLYPLYLEVLNRSSFRFEELTPQYFAEHGQRLGKKSLFFIWRRQGKPIAFCSCIGHEGVLRDNYIGMNYSIALESHLYYRTFRDIVVWAKANGFHTYYSAPLNYQPKYHLRMSLSPLDLYVRFRLGGINPIFRIFLRWMEPTRHDPTLRRFANAQELY